VVLAVSGIGLAFGEGGEVDRACLLLVVRLGDHA